MLLPRPGADQGRVRLYGVLVGLTLAVLASVLSLAPVALRRPAPKPPVLRGTTFLYAVPLTGGAPRLVRTLNGQWGWPRPVDRGRELELEKPFPDHTELWRLPLAGGPLVRAGSIVRLEQPAASGRFVATVWHTMHHGILTVRNPSGSVAWRHAVPPQTTDVAIAPDGRSAVILRNGGLQLLGAHRQRYLSRGVLIEPAFAPDGTTIYALRVKVATSMPK